MRKFLLASFLMCFFSAHAQTIDPSFDVLAGIKSSKSGGVRVIQPYVEGYLIGGLFDNFQGLPMTSLVKVDGAGVVDEKFNVRFEPAIVYDFAILPDNSIIAVGAFQKVNDGDHLGIVKILPDGSVDDKFNLTGLTKGGEIRTIVVDDKRESAFVGGEFSELDGEGWNNIARISLVDGTIVQEFTPTGSKGGTGIYDIDYISGAGRMMVAGEFDTFNDEDYVNIIRIFDDGNTDDSFKPLTSSGRFNAIDLATKDNSILIGGEFSGINGAKISNLALLDANGNHINTFNAGTIDGSVNNVEIPDSGPMLIVGEFSSVSGLSRPNVALINPSSGQAIAAIGPGSGLDRPGYAIGPGVNGGLIIGGDYTTYDCNFSYGATKIQLESAGETTITVPGLDVTDFCAGDATAVSFTANGNFCNNTFQVQLSGPGGSFNNPRIIGSLVADVERGKAFSSSIAATIPTNAPFGSNYAIRVVGTSPGVISNTVSPITIAPALGTTGAISGPSNACAGADVSFSVAPVTGATGYNWLIPSGAKIISGDGTNAITVTMGTASGTVRVTPVGNCGNGTSSSTTISILSPPPSNIGNLFGPTALCVGINAEYGFDGSGGNYVWSVPSGVSIISGQGTSLLTVRASGAAVDGEISVVQTNACGTSNPSTRDVTIFQIQDAGPIVASNDTPCDDEIVTLTVSDVGASGFSWQEFDGITPLNDSSETIYTFITNGNSGTITYNFSFNQCGDGFSYATSIPITSKQSPGSMGALSIPSIVCENETGVVMSVPTVTGATGYQWTLPSDAIVTSGDDTESITVTVGTSSGLVSVGAYNECGFGGSQEDNLAITGIPSSLGPISGPTTVCANSGASYSVTAPLRTANYVWSLPIGATFGSDPNSSSIEVNFASSGGTISVANQNSCGIGPASQLVVDVDPLPVVGQITGPLSPCEQSTGLTYQVPSVPGATSYNWSGLGVEIVSEDANRATVNIGSSAATLRVTVRNDCGLDRAELDITPAPLPDDAGPISGTARMCPESGGMEYFIDPIKNADSYSWSLPKGATIVKGDGTSSIIVDFGDTDGLITVTPQNKCGDGGSSEISIVFDPLPIGVPVITGVSNPCPGVVYPFAVDAIKSATGYTWSLPAGATIVSGGGTNVNIRFGNNSGNVRVTPTNKCGNGSTASFPVTIDLPPTLSGISGFESVCESDIVTYSIDPVADAVSYQWSFPADAKGDPGTNTAQVQFGQESGTVSVEVKDACTSVVETLDVTVNLLPGNAGIISGPTTVCEFEQGVNFSISPVANATTYTWTGPSGIGINNNGNNAVSVDFNEADGIIRVTPSNSCGDGGSRAIVVRYDILEDPQPLEGPVSTCSNNVETFSIPAVSGASSYDWSFPADAFIVSGLGTNSIELQIGNTGGTVSVSPVGDCGPGNSSSLTYVVDDVVANAGSSQNICGNSAVMNASLNPGERGTWTVLNGSGDFSDDTDPNTTVTNLGEGYNEFRWEVSNATCTSFSVVGIDVTYPVTPSVRIAAGSNPICSGELTSFSANVSNGGASPTFVWRKNGGVVGTNAATYSDAALVNGDQISLDVTSSETCVTSSTASSNTITMSVTTTVTPTVAIEADNSTICEGGIVTYTVVDSTGGGATPSFQWYKNNALLPVSGNTFLDNSPANGDEYYVEMTTSSSCASVSMATSPTETIVAQAAPNAIVATTYDVCNTDGVVDISGSFTGATGVQWTTDGEGSFADPTSANTQYILGGNDEFASFISLTMETTGNGPCPVASGFGSINVVRAAEVNIGGDLSMCAADDSILLSSETANWSVLFWTTSGTGSFGPGVDNTAPTYIPSQDDKDAGSVTLTINASSSPVCTDVSESIQLTINPNPSISAGSDQIICSGRTTLEASTLNAGETGLWTLYAGSVNFTDELDPVSEITGIQVGDNQLIWEVDNGQCSSSDTVNINRGVVPAASVESDKVTCETTSSISGNTPRAIENGIWTVYTGSGTFADPSSSNTTVSGLSANADNQFIWTVTRGNCSNSDTLTITQISPVQALAGSDIEVCADSAQLMGNAPGVGESATWSLYTGNGLLANANQSNTKVNFLSEGVNEFIYSISNNGCFTYDTVSVLNNEIQLAPIPASAICGDEATLSASLEDGEFGVWSVLNGAGTFVDNTDPNTMVQNMSEGVNRYRFIANKGNCADTTFQRVTTEYITTPSATIAVGTNPICNGELTSFSATISDGGASPVLQWKLNGTDVGNGSTQFESSTLANGDEISLEMTSNKICVTTSSATSNIITMVVTSNVVPTTGISVASDSLCGVQEVIFSVVDSTGGGQTPTFEWFRNETIQLGLNGNKLTIADPVDGDEFFVRMTSTSTCATKTYDSSEVVVMHVFEVPVANAGPDFVTCGPEIQLNGNALQGTQTGLWTIVPPGSASIENTGVPAAVVGDVEEGLTEFVWSVSQEGVAGCVDSDTVEVEYNILSPEAGSTKVTRLDLITLNGSNPGAATGEWTSLNTNISITQLSATSIEATGLEEGLNRFVWTLSLNGCEASDTVNVYYQSNLPLADAGPDQSICINSTTMDAVPALSGATGTWSLYQGTATIDNPADPETAIFNIFQGKNIFVWTVDNGLQASDTMVISFQVPVVAVPDTIELVAGDSIGIDVLTNDTTSGGDQLKLQILRFPVFGQVTVSLDSTVISFASNDPTILGNDTVEYRVFNQCASADTGLVVVQTLNTGPKFVDDIIEAFSGENKFLKYAVSLIDINLNLDPSSPRIVYKPEELSTDPEIFIVGDSLFINLDLSKDPDYVTDDDSITYEVCDVFGECAVSKVLLKISALPVVDNSGGKMPVKVYEGISPNGDDLNETWFIENIDQKDPDGKRYYPDASVAVVNRWGETIYYKVNYDNEEPWDGTKNGEVVPNGVYYYIIDLGNNERLEGQFIVKK